MDIADLWKLGLLLVCLALSGVFSASETAFIALPRVRLMHLVHIGHPGAGRVSRLIQHPEKLLATVLLSNNLVNTAAAALATALAISMIENQNVAVLASTLGVTAVILVFGETIPKTIAWNRAEIVAFAVSRPLTLVGWVFSPAIRLLQILSSLVTGTLGINGPPTMVSEEEIRSMISVSAQAGTVEATEAQLLEKVFHFGDRQVREIMTPRPEIVWVEKGATLETFLEQYTQHSHTRFPVFEGSMENVVGVLSIKDVLLAVGKGEMSSQDDVTTLLRPAFFIPETKTIGATFSEMQQGTYGLVLTVDEFGGIAGLATSKQLLEVIVGVVDAESDTPEEVYTSVDENTFRVAAGAGIAEINEKLSLGLPEGEYQTVAGFVLDRMGRIPEEGESVRYQGLRLTVKVMDGVRIDEVEVTQSAGADGEDQQGEGW